jgi:hypothetical protein
VHALTDGIPDNSKVFVLLFGEHFYSNSDTAAVTLYLENIKIFGGGLGNLIVDYTNNDISVYGKNCDFFHSTGNDFKANAVSVAGCNFAYFQGCRAATSEKDGFNYTSYNIAQIQKQFTKFIEVDCQGFLNGVKNIVTPNVNNGSTSHAGCKGIRINGLYHHNYGANVCDVQANTQTVNMGCKAFDSLYKLGGTFDCNFGTQQTGEEMWMIGCEAFGNANDIVANVGTTVHVWNSQYDTIGGTGTKDLVGNY